MQSCFIRLVIINEIILFINVDLKNLLGKYLLVTITPDVQIDTSVPVSNSTQPEFYLWSYTISI